MFTQARAICVMSGAYPAICSAVSSALPTCLPAGFRLGGRDEDTAHASAPERLSFLSKHNLDVSMSRRGNCHDNAVAESIFQRLKRERIRRRTYITRHAAKQDVFDYIEMFYNPTRKHTNNGKLSPVDYEREQKKTNEAGV